MPHPMMKLLVKTFHRSENISDDQPIRPKLMATPQGHVVVIPPDFLPRNVSEITLDRARKYAGMVTFISLMFYFLPSKS